MDVPEFAVEQCRKRTCNPRPDLPQGWHPEIDSLSSGGGSKAGSRCRTSTDPQQLVVVGLLQAPDGVLFGIIQQALQHLGWSERRVGLEQQSGASSDMRACHACAGLNRKANIKPVTRRGNVAAWSPN